VRQTTQPVVQTLPPAVQAPVAQVEDTLQQTAAAVDHALAPVTGRLPLGR
jgi:NAD/NADP transhydrogenase beta subunit